MGNMKSWAAYYRRFGCLCCHKRRQPHGNYGLCDRCDAQVMQRLQAIVGQMAVARA